MAFVPAPPAPVSSPSPPATPRWRAPGSNVPVSWAPPASGAGPTQVTVAVATHNMGGDQVPFDASWRAAFTPLRNAAEELWEIDANVQFDNVNCDDDANPADIRVGLGDSPNDPSSVRYPKVTTTNGVPDDADLAAIQAIYGKPPAPLGLSDTDLSFLKGLTAPFLTGGPS